MQKGKVIVVVGGQWGSEAKGLCCQHLVKTRDIGASIRTGAINAGHTVYENEKPYAMCQVPVAWINPNIKLLIGAGAYVEPEILDKEVKLINSLHEFTTRTNEQLTIDLRAFSHSKDAYDVEKGMHERMGSTAHGCGAALIQKVERKSADGLFVNSKYFKENNIKLFKIGDTTTIMQEVLNKGQDVLVEGTQGTLLDLHFGSYPYCTSRSTIAAGWLAECGLPPKNTEVVMVLRTYPIRVAGNSGPMRGEVSWYELVKTMNARREKVGMSPLVDPAILEEFNRLEIGQVANMGIGKLPYDMSPAERAQFSTELSNFHREVLSKMTDAQIAELKKVIEITTVTKKVRRIGVMNDEDLRLAAKLNGPDAIFLNFLNYKFPELWGARSWSEIEPVLEKEVRAYLKHIETVTQCPVKWVSTAANIVIEV